MNRATPHALHDSSIPPSPVIRWAGWVSEGGSASGVVIIIILISSVIISAPLAMGVGKCIYPGDGSPPQHPSGMMQRTDGAIPKIYVLFL